MPLMDVPTTRSGDSLPAELRGYSAWARGTDMMAPTRLWGNQAGITGLSATQAPPIEPPTPVTGESNQHVVGYVQAAVAHLPPQAIKYLDAQYPGWRRAVGRGHVPVVVAQMLDSAQPGWRMRVGLQGLGGLGDTVCPDYPDFSTCYDTAPLPVGGSGTIPDVNMPGLQLPAPIGWSGPTVAPLGSSVPAPPPGYVWATLANSAGTSLARILATSQGMGSQTLPNGAQIIYPQGTQSTLFSTTGQLGQGGAVNLGPGGVTGLFVGSTWVLLVLGLGLLFVMGSGRGR